MQTKQQLEARALQIIAQAKTSGRGDEDSFVELKSSFPDDHIRTARQIAALCNAARGNEVIWLIGINEDNGEPVGVSDSDLQSWWPQVEKCFDEFSPDFVNLNVPVQDGRATVVALFFATDRAPYVVKTKNGSGVDREVPWRSGTRTRSAKRSELISILHPERRMPGMELLRAEGSITCQSRREVANPYHNSGGRYTKSTLPPSVSASFPVDVFVDATHPITFPTHRASALLSISFLSDPIPLRVAFGPPSSTTWLDVNDYAALVKNPTLLSAYLRGPVIPVDYSKSASEQDMQLYNFISQLTAENFLELEIELVAAKDLGFWKSSTKLQQQRDKNERFPDHCTIVWKSL
ncbi:hypothetical protein ATK30_7389 [Amycolatopsis echigonensis]|uniref:Schlafen AlbA-2 domain-containing protein n=1 Tax=Amycolatopsis echigonensis TaxID=2576905 RepID=A0A2N3WRD3_9PSEU|nr:ATP-binding protein [Amycolatopsis niigatensis]PKV96441.1 hypothetical protein ATK30_7389 [Amycolatopsis niigatensis]